MRFLIHATVIVVLSLAYGRYVMLYAIKHWPWIIADPTTPKSAAGTVGVIAFGGSTAFLLTWPIDWVLDLLLL